MDKRAVSPDSSTQITEKKKKEKKRKKKHRSEKKRNQPKSPSSSQDVDSDGVKTRIKRKKDCKASSVKHLSAYLHDKEELQVQLFTIIPKKEVKGMMPDALKELSFTEVKTRCFEQLQMFSKKQIESIIEGKQMGSFEDDTDNEPEISQETETTEGQMRHNQGRVLDAKENMITNNKEEEVKERDIITFQEVIAIPKQDEIDKLVEGTSVLSREAPCNVQSDDTSVAVEADLKELEFRARALESLVRARERQMNLDQP